MPPSKSDHEISLDQITENIRNEFRSEFSDNNTSHIDHLWVVEVFEDRVIVDSDGDLFSVDFTKEDDEIVFVSRNEWVEVDKEVEFVEKSAMAFVRETGINALKTISKTDKEFRVGNYIVLFGDEDKRDLQNEWFTEKTNLQSSYTDLGTLYVDWEHGWGKDIDGVGPGKHDVLGVVDWSTAKIDERGVWAQRVLDRRNEYMEYIEPMIEADLIGTSSKAIASDAVISESGEIVKWPLERDTLTVMPAEFRMMTGNQIGALKSLVKAFPHLAGFLPKESEDSKKKSKTKAKPKPKQPLEVKTIMKTREEFLKFYADKMGLEVDELDDKQKAIALNGTEFSVEDEEPSVNPRMDAIEKQMDEFSKNLSALLQYAQDTPSISQAGYLISETGGTSDKNIYSLTDYMVAVARNDRERLKAIYGSQYEGEAAKADMSHIDGSTGGFLLPTEFENNLLALASEMAPIMDMVTRVPVGSNRGQWPVLDQGDAPTAGAGNTAFAGAVVATPTGENTALTETSPLFKLIQWNIHKIGGFTQAPNELIDDSPQSLEVLLEALFVMAIAAKVEHYIFRGTGANEPLGILNTNALISVNTVSDNTFALADALNMLSRFKPFLSQGSWWMHRGVIPDLGVFEVSAGSPAVLIQDLKNDPVINTPLLNKPVFFSEHLPQDDNSGDVILIDPKAYLLFERKGMTIDFSRHFAFTSDQGTWRFTRRLDGQPWVPEAVTLADPQGSFTVSPYVKHND